MKLMHPAFVATSTLSLLFAGIFLPSSAATPPLCDVLSPVEAVECDPCENDCEEPCTVDCLPCEIDCVPCWECDPCESGCEVPCTVDCLPCENGCEPCLDDSCNPVLALLSSDYCVDDEHGVRTESYSCTVYCGAGENVGAIISTDQAVDQIVVGYDCGNAIDGKSCKGLDYCEAIERAAKTAAKGSCHGYSKELNYAESYWGDLYCYSNDDDTFAASPEENHAQSMAAGGVSCELLEADPTAFAWQVPSYVQVSFEVGPDDLGNSAMLTLKGAAIHLGECTDFAPGASFQNGGWLVGSTTS
jgi:hypothetical protein